MKNKTFLTTGEFAKLCKTTKETLFHYDREKLLTPRYVSENGYRHYGVEQYFDFDMIAMFKDSGSSLKEVKEGRQKTDGSNFLSLLEDKLCIVKKERLKLTQREKRLRDMVEGTREALEFKYDTVVVQEHDEERMEIIPVEGTPSSVAEFVISLAEYANFYAKQDRTPHYLLGTIINQADVMEKQYADRFFFSRATRSTPQSLLHVKPKGKYAVFAHKGTFDTHLKAFNSMLQQIDSAGMIVTGNCYCYDMMSYVLFGNTESYAAKYCTAVK